MGSQLYLLTHRCVPRARLRCECHSVRGRHAGCQRLAQANHHCLRGTVGGINYHKENKKETVLAIY